MYCYKCGATVTKEDLFICPKCKTDNAFNYDTIMAAASGDAAAFEELYERSYMSVYTTVRAILNNPDDVDDIVQDTYVKAYQSLDTITSAGAFRTWICTIGRNKALDYVRKNKPVVFADMASENEEGDEFEYDVKETDVDRLPEEHYEREEMHHMLFDELLSVLPEEQRVAITLVMLEDKTEREAAEILGISQNTVKSRVRYAKKKLTEKAEEMKKKGVKFYGFSGVSFAAYLYRQLMLLPLKEGVRAGAAAAVISAANAAAGGAIAAGGLASGAAVQGAAMIAEGAALGAAGAAGAASGGAAAGTAGVVGGLFAKVGAVLSAKVIAGVVAGGLLVGGAVTGGVLVHRNITKDDVSPAQAVATESVYEEASEATTKPNLDESKSPENKKPTVIKESKKESTQASDENPIIEETEKKETSDVVNSGEKETSTTEEAKETSTGTESKTEETEKASVTQSEEKLAPSTPPFSLGTLAGEGYTVSVNRVSSEYSNVSTGLLNSGAGLYIGDHLQINYLPDTSKGAVITGNGPSDVVVSDSFSPDQITASVEYHMVYTFQCVSTNGTVLATVTDTCVSLKSPASTWYDLRQLSFPGYTYNDGGRALLQGFPVHVSEANNTLEPIIYKPDLNRASALSDAEIDIGIRSNCVMSSSDRTSSTVTINVANRQLLEAGYSYGYNQSFSISVGNGSAGPISISDASLWAESSDYTRMVDANCSFTVSGLEPTTATLPYTITFYSDAPSFSPKTFTGTMNIITY